jgi:hypothetical protein
VVEVWRDRMNNILALQLATPRYGAITDWDIATVVNPLFAFIFDLCASN